jgi:hypothetical protein
MKYYKKKLVLRLQCGECPHSATIGELLKAVLSWERTPKKTRLSTIRLLLRYWDVKSNSLVGHYQRFGENCCLCLQDSRGS